MSDNETRRQLDSSEIAPAPLDCEKPLPAKASGSKTEEAFVLRVELPLGKRAVWRQVAVPARATFHQLHLILQACFNWQDGHLHQFQLMDTNGAIVAESKPISYAGEFLDEPVTVRHFSERKMLSCYLPPCRQMTYLYDFGDGWVHLIEVAYSLEAEVGTLPVCLYGVGDAPPDDVGGEPGFNDFMKLITSEPKNERAARRKKETLAWAQAQGWEPFSLDAVNARLKKLRKAMKKR